MFQYTLFNDIFINSETREELEFHTMNWDTISALRKHFDKETKIVLLIEGIFMVRY